MNDDSLGVLLLLLSLCCLGTWPALLRLASSSENARRSGCGCSSRPSTSRPHSNLRWNRHVSHVFVDYATTYVLVSSLPWFWAGVEKILGNHTTSEKATAPVILVGMALLGGNLLCLGNISMQWATAVYQAPLTTVLALQASLTVIMGTSINYWLEPSQTAHPGWLGGGVLVFLVAILLATQTQLTYLRQRQELLVEENDDHDGLSVHRYGEVELHYGSHLSIAETDDDLPPADLSHENHVHPHTPPPYQGVLVAFAGGLCFGFFSPAFNVAVNNPFHWGRELVTSQDDALSVASANAWFSVGFWITSVIGNISLRRITWPESSLLDIWRAYVHEPLRDRGIAILAGLVCALGNVLQFQGGLLVGYATADLVQAYPLVSTIWDVTLFGEFRHIRPSSAVGLMLMSSLGSYLMGIVLLAKSSFD